MTDLTIIKKSLLARPLSTGISVLSVAVAAALMMVLLSLRDAGLAAFSRGTGNMHILISAEPSPLGSVLSNVFYASPPQKKLLLSDLEKLGLLPALGRPERPRDPRVEFAVPVQSGDSFRAFRTMATTPEFFSKFQPAEGSPWTFASGQAFAGTWEVVLGAQVAAVTRLRVGDEIYITHGWSQRSHTPVPGDTPATKKEDDHDHAHGDHDHDHDAMGASGEHIHNEHPFKVVGILNASGSPHDRAVFLPLQASWVLHAAETRLKESPDLPPAREENLRPQEMMINGVYIRCRSAAVIGEVFSELRATPGLTAALPKSQVDALFEIVGSIDKIILAIAMAVLVSSGVSVMLALYNSMEQRRRQIAVLRVLGASRWKITSLVLTESAVIAFIGAALGAAVALIGMQVAAGALLARTGVVISPSIEPAWVLLVSFGAVMLGTLAGVVPAVSAYRTSVVRSLRPLG